MVEHNGADGGTKSVELYSVDSQIADEKSFSESIESGKVDFTEFKRIMLKDIITNSDIIETGYIGKIKLEDVQHAMQHPAKMWRVLLRASQELMLISPHYYRMNTLFSNMALFCWWIDLYDVKDSAKMDSIQKQYKILASKLENMHLKHEFSKIMRCLPYQDVYCGLVVENGTDFFFQKIDYSICKLYQIQDGLYNFKIDLTKIKATELGAYPDYVQKDFIDFHEGKCSSRWCKPDGDKQICIKLNSQWTFPYPILIGLIKDVLDIDVYKKLKLQSARTDNYKAILVEVPIDSTTVDKPLLSPNVLSMFAEINRESMNSDIGMIHTLGSKGEAISFKDSSNTRNNVSDAVEELYNASGESKELFNGSSSATAVTFSVENDSGFVYHVYRQLERWVNRYIKIRKYSKASYKFYFYLLDITIFNRDTVTKRYKDAASFGACIDRWLASLDMTPARTLGSFVVNNVIFDFGNNLRPLSTSYNGSPVSDGAGRPISDDVGDEGEKMRDKDKNADR